MVIWFCRNAGIAALHHVIEITMLCPKGMFSEQRKTHSDTLSPLIITRSTSVPVEVMLILYFTQAYAATPTHWSGLHMCSNNNKDFLRNIQYSSSCCGARIIKANWCNVCPFVWFTRGHGGVGRGAVAPRGKAATHSALPTTVLSREVQAPRARSAAGNPGYRPPLLPLTHESYDDYVSPIPPGVSRRKKDSSVHQSSLNPLSSHMNECSFAETLVVYTATRVWKIRASREILKGTKKYILQNWPQNVLKAVIRLKG